MPPPFPVGHVRKTADGDNLCVYTYRTHRVVRFQASETCRLRCFSDADIVNEILTPGLVREGGGVRWGMALDLREKLAEKKRKIATQRSVS